MDAATFHVLVVEDDRDIRQAFVQTLEEEGYRACGARHGKEALDLLLGSATLPKLILLDLMMPVMDGWQFRVEQKREARIAEIPVVVISADGSVTDRLRTMGASAFLKKPVAFDDLMAVVHNHCD